MPKPYTLDVTYVFLPTPTSDAAMDGSPPEIAIEPSPPDAAMASPPDPSTPDAAMEGQRAPASGLAAASALAASGQGAPDLGDAGLAAPLDGGRSAPAAGLAAALQHLPPRWRATRSQGAAALTAARRPAEARTPLVAYYCEHVGRCWRMVPARR